MKVATTVLLVRHAEHTDFDVRLSGRRPGVALSERGRAQAAALARRLTKAGIDTVETSPLDRTRGTAQAVAAATGVPMRDEAALVELDLGDWTGRAIGALHGDPAWQAWNERRATARIPGGETMGEAQARIVAHLTATAAREPGRTVAMVSHSDMIRAAVCWALGLSLDNLLRFDIGPASISRLVVGDWGARVLGLNEGVVWMADGESLRERVAALAPWFHNIDLGDGLVTAPDHFLGDYPRFKFARFADALPTDLTGKSVLDIGCNAGFYSVEMKRRGAVRVLGIDSDDRYLAQARLATEALGWSERDGGVEFRNLSVYDVAALDERFDLVIFMGVLYHLRHPLLALDLIREHVAGDMLLFQTMQQGGNAVAQVPEDHPFHQPGTFDPPVYFMDPGYPAMRFIEHRFAGDWTNWWAPNAACSAAMLRAAGFTILAHPEEEVWLCRVAPVPYGEWGDAAVYPARAAGEAR